MICIESLWAVDYSLPQGTAIAAGCRSGIVDTYSSVTAVHIALEPLIQVWVELWTALYVFARRLASHIASIIFIWELAMLRSVAATQNTPSVPLPMYLSLHSGGWLRPWRPFSSPPKTRRWSVLIEII